MRLALTLVLSPVNIGLLDNNDFAALGFTYPTAIAAIGSFRLAGLQGLQGV